MATLNKPRPQGGRGTRFINELLDRLGTGNRGYNYRYGTWDPNGARVGAIQSGIGALIPGGGALAGAAYDAYNNFRLDNTRGRAPTGDLGKPQGFGVAPAMPIGFTPTWAPNAPVGYGAPDPNAPSRFGTISSAPEQLSNPYTNWRSPVGGAIASSQMGGARGQYSQGGYTGEAARALLQAMQQGPQSFDVGYRGDYLL